MKPPKKYSVRDRRIYKTALLRKVSLIDLVNTNPSEGMGLVPIECTGLQQRKMTIHE